MSNVEDLDRVLEEFQDMASQLSGTKTARPLQVIIPHSPSKVGSPAPPPPPPPQRSASIGVVHLAPRHTSVGDGSSMQRSTSLGAPSSTVFQENGGTFSQDTRKQVAGINPLQTGSVFKNLENLLADMENFHSRKAANNSTSIKDNTASIKHNKSSVNNTSIKDINSNIEDNRTAKLKDISVNMKTNKMSSEDNNNINGTKVTNGIKAGKTDTEGSPGKLKTLSIGTPTKAIEEDSALEETLDQLTDRLVRSFQGKEDIEDRSDSGTDLGTCKQCKRMIVDRAVLVGQDNYHEDCFACTECGDRLSGQYYIVDGRHLCEKHKMVLLDKCRTCGEYLSGDFLRLGADKFHMACFACSQCRQPLTGKFFTTPEGKMICEVDYKNSREACHHCGLPMLDKILTAGDKKYHPACFRCSLCDCGLDGVPFVLDGKIPNCKDCFSRYKAKQCCICGEGIVSSMEMKTTLISCDGRSYHEQCYNCKDCGLNLSGVYCFTIGDDILCTDCEIRRKKLFK